MEQQKTTVTPQQGLEIVTDFEVRLRGNVLRYFIPIEQLMDDVIRIYSFDTIEEFYNYKNGLKGKMSVSLKVDFLFDCIIKYEKEFGKSFEVITKQLHETIRQRDIMAHWMLDTSWKRINEFGMTGKLYFVQVENDKEKKRVYVHREIILTLESNMKAILKGLLEMRTDIKNKYPQKPDEPAL